MSENHLGYAPYVCIQARRICGRLLRDTVCYSRVLSNDIVSCHDVLQSESRLHMVGFMMLFLEQWVAC
uniref:Uncharacterized protein n=1 Tax=Arundo donax TaxID=35708 RepID=A0A0A9QLH0_ARUDO